MSPRRACRGPSKLQGQADHLKMINSIVLERCQNRLPVFSSRRNVLTNGKARPSKQFQKSFWAPQIPSQGPPGARASPLAKIVFSSFGRPSKVPGPTGPVKLINSTVLSRCQNRLPKSEPREKSLRFLKEWPVSGFFLVSGHLGHRAGLVGKLIWAGSDGVRVRPANHNH